MREASLQANIVELAFLLGWRVMHVGDSRRSIGAGWPDLVMVRPPRVLVFELKREGRYPTATQRDWLAALGACPGVEPGVWRPRDWLDGTIERRLAG